MPGDAIAPLKGGYNEATPEGESSLASLMETLTNQKAELRKEVASQAVRKKRSLSTPALTQTTQLKSSTMPGSASFAFGKPRHGRGPFKIQTLAPRDIESCDPEALMKPGVGTYDLKHTDGRPDFRGHGGATGGWSRRDHDVFMRTLGEFGRHAGPDFFDEVAFRLPGLARETLVDHSRWLADYEKDNCKTERRLRRWREDLQQIRGESTEASPGEGKAKDLKKERMRQQFLETKAHRELHEHADMEDSRGTTRRLRLADTHQRFQGQVLDSNLRGHPAFTKSPGYTFGCSREMRDHTAKSLTGLSHVRSSSHLDNPGPGHYTGLDEPYRQLLQKPAYSFGLRPPQRSMQGLALSGPGYDGPADASFKIQDQLRVIQNEQPSWKIGTEHARFEGNSNEMYAITDKLSSPPNVGPGKYEHATAFLSQY
mmetsp:Transcript_93754/g.201280  ORF Transcript_93754/g.201280 Transcript_93754/m.201280 type:complete len:427 (-) Transcript_93754:54-1334(-)